MQPIPQLARAILRREPLRESRTDAFRLVDGAGDGLPELEIEDFAGRWLVQTREADFPEWLSEMEGGPASLYWKRLGEQKQPPAWVAGSKIAAPFEVMENGMRFEIDFAAGYSQGIFLDQRDNRAEVRRTCKGLRVLNCFAYTCAFGVAAALGGAETVNLDLSRPYLEWGRRNYRRNGVNPEAHEFVYGDTANWLRRFARKARRFDLVILDPPTFSRDKEGRVFTIEGGFAELVRAAEAVLAPGGRLFCSTNQRNLWPETFQRLILSGLEHPRRWKIEEREMPADFTGEKYLKSCWVSAR